MKPSDRALAQARQSRDPDQEPDPGIVARSLGGDRPRSLTTRQALLARALGIIAGLAFAAGLLVALVLPRL
jgi:hypothetical protein